MNKFEKAGMKEPITVSELYWNFMLPSFIVGIWFGMAIYYLIS